MHAVKLACEAMATRFEIVLPGDDPVRLRAAGEAALAEIRRLEEQLSLYRATSEVARVNRGAGAGPVPVSPPVFELLERCVELWRISDGAFDITVAPLVRAWGFMQGTGRAASSGEVAAALEQVGMKHLELDSRQRTVRFTRPGMMLDLGAVGKGQALDVAAEILQEAGVERAFLHGGTSSCYGLGGAGEGADWRVAVTPDDSGGPVVGAESADSPRGGTVAVVALRNAALSVSGVRGKAVAVGGRTLGHVIDPRSGEPVTGAPLAAVVSRSAAESDALSTALLLTGAAGLEKLASRRPHLGLLCAVRAPDGKMRLAQRGWPPGV